MKTYEELFPQKTLPVLIAAPDNICYTTGFYTTARRPKQIGYTCVLLTPEGSVFFCPAAWHPCAEAQLGDGLVLRPYAGGADALAAELKPYLCGAAEAGLDMTGTELELYMAFCRALPELCWQDVTAALQAARAIKSPEEICALRASADVACAAMERARELLRPGKTERQIAAELEFEMKKRGSDGTPFTMKVLSGEHAVRTVNVPDDRQIRAGEAVLLDFGATVQHYASDWTRCFVPGKPSEALAELYQLVWDIERACLDAVRPGVTADALFAVADRYLERSRFGKGFNPYLGHSIGLTSQEWPQLTRGSRAPLRENMVVSIEPGVYIPGVGGIRIEDELVIGSDGAERITGLREEGFVLDYEI